MAQIYRRNNLWTYRVWLDHKHSKSKGGFKRRKDAQDAALELELKKKDGTLSEQSDISFAEYFKTWAETYKIGRLHSSTESKYRMAIRLVEDTFNDKKLKNIKTYDYQKMLDLYAKSHARTSTSLLNSYYRNAVRYAMNDGIISRDFTFGALISGNESKDSSLKFIEYDEAEKLKEVCIETGSFLTITRLEILFGLLTGCRYGEVTGLTWDCVDLVNRNVTIDKAYDYIKRTGFKKTKTTSSIRTISINDTLITMFKDLKEQQSKLFATQGFNNKLNFVFITKYHEIPSDNAVNKTLRKILTELDTKNKITFHGLRHTHASMLISQDVSINYISERLGHANISVTYNIYTHLLKTSREQENNKAMDVLNNL
ncbi:tyrosine-type recombinase/integrase [Dellaglioa algida]|uniref:tyrosine-type recombinase/integrase n=1 Tax=Dellaglioa algida TaxID=105612 RepID=UPI0024C4E329|nr:tyrosine-type recombinase/integrase [Dellaglioa algida]MDK1716590.1 site-specific integrase [Dellaglioa algida]MDK1721532.1 site-specific integrase [Dellaglioa algida]